MIRENTLSFRSASVDSSFVCKSVRSAPSHTYAALVVVSSVRHWGGAKCCCVRELSHIYHLRIDPHVAATRTVVVYHVVYIYCVIYIHVCVLGA